MNVRFSRDSRGLCLYVVPETDADRLALRAFADGFPETSASAGLSVQGDHSSFATGVDHTVPGELGPAALVFRPPPEAAAAPHAAAGPARPSRLPPRRP